MQAVGGSEPVCIALIGTDAYITDEDATYPALYVVDVALICKSFNTAEPRDGRGSITRVKLRGKVKLQHPFGLAADEAASELFVGCQGACAIMRVTLSSTADGSIELLCPLPTPPFGIDLMGATATSPSRLVVAAGDAVFLIDREEGSKLMVLQQDGAAFCDVRIAPLALDGDLFAIDHGGNSVLRLGRLSSEPASASLFRPSSAVEMLAGGNAASPLFWYEGTASRVELWKPTFGVFPRNAFVFMNAGHGNCSKVLVLNDLLPMVKVMLWG